MTEHPDVIQARIRAAQQRLREEAAEASKHIGRMLLMQGMLDPQERDLLETAQAVVDGFAR